MKTLLVNTSTTAGVIGIAQDGKVLAEVNLALAASSSKVVCAIDEAVHQSRTCLGDVDSVIVAKGPGTFTGTRVGVSVAKAIAYALPCSIASVSTFEVVAWAGIQASDGACVGETVWALLDARRNEFYVQQFVHRDGVLEPCGHSACGGPGLLESVVRSRGSVACAFSAALIAGLDVLGRSGVAWQFNAYPTCTSMIAAAVHAVREDPLSLEPVYLRTTEELFDRPRNPG